MDEERDNPYYLRADATDDELDVQPEVEENEEEHTLHCPFCHREIPSSCGHSEVEPYRKAKN